MKEQVSAKTWASLTTTRMYYLLCLDQESPDKGPGCCGKRYQCNSVNSTLQSGAGATVQTVEHRDIGKKRHIPPLLWSGGRLPSILCLPLIVSDGATQVKRNWLPPYRHNANLPWW